MRKRRNELKVVKFDFLLHVGTILVLTLEMRAWIHGEAGNLVS